MMMDDGDMMMEDTMMDEGDMASHSQVDLSAAPDFQGVLDDNDARRDGKPADSYTIQARVGTEVSVTMTAEDFDTYLVVQGPNGKEWTNDDFGDTRTSQVTFMPVATGAYTVVATAYAEEGRGAYEIRVKAVTATIVSTVEGRLDYQDMQQIKGEFYDTLTITPPSQGEFYVDLLSLGFNGFIRVTSPSGVRTNGEPTYEPQTPIRVGPFTAERGTWTVDVTTGSPDEVGAYDVRVITLDEQ